MTIPEPITAMIPAHLNIDADALDHVWSVHGDALLDRPMPMFYAAELADVLVVIGAKAGRVRAALALGRAVDSYRRTPIGPLETVRHDYDGLVMA